MKNGLNEEEVWPNELPGLRSSRDREGKEGRRGEPLRKKGAAAMPKVCQLLLTSAPMAQTAPGRSPAILVLCQRRREDEHQVCVQPEKVILAVLFLGWLCVRLYMPFYYEYWRKKAAKCKHKKMFGSFLSCYYVVWIYPRDNCIVYHSFIYL